MVGPVKELATELMEARLFVKNRCGLTPREVPLVQNVPKPNLAFHKLEIWLKKTGN